MKNKVLFLIVLISLFLFVSCSSDMPYTPPSKVESNDQLVSTEKPVAIKSSEIKTQPEPVKSFEVGETVTDNQLKVTVNGFRLVSKIDEKNNEYNIAEAPTGKEYAIVDIIVENYLQDKTQTISTLTETTLVDKEGYNYDFDIAGFLALEKGFKDGEILPGMKKRGEIVYLVPASATDLKFIYKFDLFTGTSAVFNLKGVPKKPSEVDSNMKKGDEFKNPIFTAIQNGISISLDNYTFVKKGDDWGKITDLTITILNKGTERISPKVLVILHDNNDKKDEWTQPKAEISFDVFSLDANEHIIKKAITDIAFNEINITKRLDLVLTDAYDFNNRAIVAISEDIKFN